MLGWHGSGSGRMMCSTPAEKMKIIRLVKESDLSVSRTLKELDVARSTFYRWHRRHEVEGYEGLR
jgi:putative transposase